MYIYIYTCIYIQYIYIHIYINKYIYIHIYIYTCIYIQYIYIHLFIHKYIYIDIYIFTHAVCRKPIMCHRWFSCLFQLNIEIPISRSLDYLRFPESAVSQGFLKFPVECCKQTKMKAATSAATDATQRPPSPRKAPSYWTDHSAAGSDLRDERLHATWRAENVAIAMVI